MKKWLLSLSLLASAPGVAARPPPNLPPLKPVMGVKHGITTYQVVDLTPTVREVLILKNDGSTATLRAEVMGKDEFEQTDVRFNKIRTVTRVKAQEMFLYADGLVAERRGKVTTDPHGLFAKYKDDIITAAVTMADLPQKTQPDVQNVGGPIDCMEASNPDLPANCSPSTSIYGTGHDFDPARPGMGMHSSNGTFPSYNPTSCQGGWHRGATVGAAESLCCLEAMADADTACSAAEGKSGGRCCNYQACDSWCYGGDYICMCGVNGRSTR